MLIIFCLFLYFVCVCFLNCYFQTLLQLLSVVSTVYTSKAKHCTQSALDTACVCFKVSASAVLCPDILQLYSIGLSFDWHSVHFVQL